MTVLSAQSTAWGWPDITILIVEVVGAAGIILSLIALIRSNAKLGASVRLSTLQAMISEMNELRRARADEPELERSLFESRQDWSDIEIKHHVAAVQLANVFEWAYLARRDGLLERDVWESWVETWRGVILASPPLRAAFTPTVWTFGRSEEVTHYLNELIKGGGDVGDPCRDRAGITKRLAGI